MVTQRRPSRKYVLALQHQLEVAVASAGGPKRALAILNANPAFMFTNRATLHRWMNTPWMVQNAALQRIATVIEILSGRSVAAQQLQQEVQQRMLEQQYLELNGLLPLLDIIRIQLNDARDRNIASPLHQERIASLRQSVFLFHKGLKRAVGTAGLLIAILTTIFPSVSHADAISFATGEQLAMVQGTTVEGSLSFGRVKFVPWALLDGSKFEAMPMWQFGGTPDSLVVGPLLGMSYDATGTTPYFGADIRGKFKLGPGTFVFRLAERHTRERLLSRFANLGLEAGSKPLRVRLSYQPLRRINLTMQRLALKATAPYRSVKIGLEVRSSLDEHHRKGAMLDLVIPLK